MRKEANENNKNMDGLLVKYMLDEVSMQEKRGVEKWIAEEPGHRNYFESFKLIWNQSRKLAKQSDVDEDLAWLRFRERVQKTERPITPLFNGRFFRILRIAAAVAIVAGGGWYAYLISVKERTTRQIAVHSGAQTLVDTLPDGSVVTLNRSSSIRYAESFTAGKTRQVTLDGEAFFEVKPDKNKPFLIRADEVVVRVVGTSFNVKSSAQKTEVVVESGLVEVSKNEQKLKIKPREMVTVLKDHDELVKQKNEDLFYNYYKTKKLVCNDTPLWKLVQILNETYHADITVSQARENYTIHTTFEGKTLDEILNIIGQTFNITIVRNDSRIILK
jgi:transmembrane sensor